MIHGRKLFAVVAAAACKVTTVYAQNHFGDATFYHTGLGSCGWQSVDTDLIAALSFPDIGWNKENCGRHITVWYQGKSTDATVVDSCPSCGPGSIDLSPAAFMALAPLDAGRIQVEWYFQ